MPKAILKGGIIYPLEPLPPDWRDGTELWVEGAREPNGDQEEVEDAFRQLEEAVKQIDEADFQKLQAAIRQVREEGKAQMRKEMGLP
jgi:hypothetical protein